MTSMRNVCRYRPFLAALVAHLIQVDPKQRPPIEKVSAGTCAHIIVRGFGFGTSYVFCTSAFIGWFALN
jgi:hypothetical protein